MQAIFTYRFLLSIVLCVLLAQTILATTESIFQIIENTEKRSCQSDVSCTTCSSIVEKILAQGDLSQKEICKIPKFESMDQYCCQMWTSFDCRSQIAIDQCPFISYIKYRKSMVAWANKLMLINICPDYDYDSKKCKEMKMDKELKDDIDLMFWNE